VIDAHGIVRARWVGGVEPKQLAAYIAAARAGRNAAFSTPEQTAIDALLAPARYPFHGTAAQRNATLAAIGRAIARADAIEDKNSATVDDERTQREEGLLRIAAGSAVRDAASTPAHARPDSPSSRTAKATSTAGPTRRKPIALYSQSCRTIHPSSCSYRERTTACTIIPT